MMRTMRTTVDIPDDIHELLRYLAASRGQSMSATVTAIVEQAVTTVDDDARRHVERERASGLLVATGGPTRSAAEVARLAADG